MNKEFVCIVCPRGCHLKYQDGTITGNACPRGVTYGKQEAIVPLRMVTSTVVLLGHPTLSRLPVMTAHEVPKAKIPEVMRAIKSLKVRPPVAMRQVIAANIADTGVDLIATRSIDSDE